MPFFTMPSKNGGNHPNNGKNYHNPNHANNGGKYSSLRYFSNNTSMHGFKRLWAKNRWRKSWALLILIATLICMYQIKSKIEVLIADPLTININLLYEDELDFPTVTICSTLKIRISYVVNDTQLLKLVHFLFPQESNLNLTNEEKNVITKIGENLTAKQFFAASRISKDELILWCRRPDGKECGSDDFKVITTDDGYCFQLTETFVVRAAGPDNSLKLLLNLAQYERIPDSDPSGVKLIIHEKNTEPMLSNGYDVTAGYQTSVVLRKTKTTQYAKCEESNPLLYHRTYTYTACRSEHRLLEAMYQCKCKPYTLPPPVPAKLTNTSNTYPDCNLMQQLGCVDQSAHEFAVSNQTRYVKSRSNCLGECVSVEFEKELSYAVFKDNLAFKRMIGAKDQLVKEAYLRGKDGGTLLNFLRHMDPYYEDLVKINGSFERLIVQKRLIPPYGSITSQLFKKHPCLFSFKSENISERELELRSIFKHFNPSLFDDLVKSMINLEQRMNELDIEPVLQFGEELKRKYLVACTDGNEMVCGLSAIYDMLNLRKMLDEKNAEMIDIISTVSRRLNDLINIYSWQNVSLLGDWAKRENHTTDAAEAFFSLITDRSNVTDKLVDYFNRINLCLANLHKIYERSLTAGQPSMKTATMYNLFLTDLRLANFTINYFCKIGGEQSLIVEQATNSSSSPSMMTSFATNSRKHLVDVIANELIKTNKTLADILKIFRFNLTLNTFVDDVWERNFPKGYDFMALNDSLAHIQSMDALIGAYLGQSLDENFTMTKSQLYDKLNHLNTPYQQALVNYKATINGNLRNLNTFVQQYIDNLYDIFPGSDLELKLLRASNGHGFQKLMQMASNNKNDTTNGAQSPTISMAAQQMRCLIETKSVLSEIEEKEVQFETLDEYKKILDSLIIHLKMYADDIKSLKGFYQDNLGLVVIYYRDISIKETTQERAYDFFSFLCDIGGTVGLWLGASMLSLIEIFDLLLYKRLRDYLLLKFSSSSKKLKEKNKDDNNRTNNNNKRKFLIQNGNFVVCSTNSNGDLPLSTEDDGSQTLCSYWHDPDQSMSTVYFDTHECYPKHHNCSLQEL